MRWESLEDALEVLETEREYDGYFCSIKDVVIIVLLGSQCEMRSVKRIHMWAQAEHVRRFLLAQRTVASKSNEIPAVQELIKELEIAGCMVVADALNCQIETAQPERKGGMDAKRDAVRIRHWLLDIHFDEDRCRVQSKNIQHNLNMLDKFALNIVRINKRETQSKLALNGIMLRSLMNPYHLLHLLGKT